MKYYLMILICKIVNVITYGLFKDGTLTVRPHKYSLIIDNFGIGEYRKPIKIKYRFIYVKAY